MISLKPLFEKTLTQLYQISTLTNKTQADRSQKLGKEFKLSNIINVELKPPDVIFTWHVKPTTGGKVEVVDIHSHKFQYDKADYYTIQISIQKFYELKGKRKLKKLSKNDITKILKSADVKLWSSSPSFQFQGFNYKLSRLNASLYPTGIPDRKWRQKHGGSLIDKHLYLLIKDIDKWIPHMAMAIKAEIKKLEG